MESKTATKRAKRTQIACFECRKNKRKCGGESPSCTLCTKSGKTCGYPSENTPRKRKYWDEDYVHSLERQLETLQELIRDLKRQLEAVNNNEPGENEQSQARVFESESLPGMKQHHDASNELCENYTDRSRLAVDELSSLMLKMDVRDVGEPCFSIPSVAIEALMKQGPRPCDLGLEKECVERQRCLPPNVQLSEEKSHLVALFIQRFNPYHQFLDLRHADIDQTSEQLDIRFLCNAVYAVGAHFLMKELRDDKVKEYSSQAANLAMQSCSQYPGAASIKGLSLLCWVEMMSGNENLAWIYNTIATGMILSLGFHVTALEKFSPLGQSEMTDEISSRVRTFWAYFSVDRIATSIMGLNCTIPWRRVRARRLTTILPSAVTVQEIAFDHQYQMWHLWDSVMDQVHAFAWNEISNSEKQRLVLQAHQALQIFHKNIPSELAIRKQHMPPFAILYHIAYHTAVLQTYRPLLNADRGSTVMKLALQTTSVAATSVSRLLRRFRSSIQSVDIVPPQIISYILSAAIIHLLNATSSDKSRRGKQAAAALQACMDALEEMRGTWGHRVSKAIDLIKGLARRWVVVWALPMRYSSFEVHRDAKEFNLEEGHILLDPCLTEADIPDLFEESDLDFWKRLDATHLPRDDISMVQFSDDAKALDWLYNYEHTELP